MDGVGLLAGEGKLFSFSGNQNGSLAVRIVGGGIQSLDTGNNNMEQSFLVLVAIVLLLWWWVMQKILIQFLPLPFIAKVIRLYPVSAF